MAKKSVILDDVTGKIQAAAEGLGTAASFGGTYTGDGTLSQAITGIGFAPRYVRVWERQATPNAALQVFETTREIVDDNVSGAAVEIAGTLRMRTDRIISLDSDGFTVDDAGTDDHPNQNGILYNFIAQR